ncbi:MFS transporter [Brachybacterium halotolerans subsp. kimchii]|uniref:MFS transporter n=1 Tax=Brachybacterium halotolerans TaxID=2795215 RepID=UPI001E50D635|nr:MFS transporter [Brachybacterium halotolerans]UEJ81497.1 MFS transporter [Brachybacterium halotolerans subsp. kimchii]
MDSTPAVDERALIKKITWHIVPFVMVLYTIAYIDRSVIGYAKLQMSTDIGLSDAAFGLGAGLFFLAYFLFEVPSNYLLPKVGPRIWFARILFTWGLITALTALTPSTEVFYVLRFLLGVAEAGFYPGVLYYLTFWFPQRHRTKATGTFVLAAPIAFLVMSPLAGSILGLDWLGLRGWHWLFVLSGLAAMIAAVPTLKWLRDTPRSAPWITASEADWIEDQLEKDRAELGQQSHANPWKALGSKYVWVFALLFFPSTVGIYGLSFWVPTVVSAFSGSDVATGWLSAIPYVFGVIGIFVTSRLASRMRENWIPLIVIYIGSAVGILLSALAPAGLLQLAAMSMAAFFLYSVAGVFWALPTRYLVGATAAIGIAFVNSFGNIGGFVGPYVVGAVSEATGKAANGMYFLGAVLILGAIGTAIGMRVWAGRNPEQVETVGRRGETVAPRNG